MIEVEIIGEEKRCDDCISRQAAIDEIEYELEMINSALDSITLDFNARERLRQRRGEAREILNSIQQLPSTQPEWNNHTVACLLAELFDDTCACNYNGIDEWLPSKCDLLDSCPNPVGVACWEQFLKYRAERRTDE